jgi:hypothetical protein
METRESIHILKEFKDIKILHFLKLTVKTSYPELNIQTSQRRLKTQ